MQTKDKIEAIILKSIEGGYPRINKEDTQYFIHYGEKRGNRLVWHCTSIEKIIFDPLFWQALGKACGWTNRFWRKKELQYNRENHDYDNDSLTTTIDPQNTSIEACIEYGSTFHEINLREDFDKAVDFLFNLIQK